MTQPVPLRADDNFPRQQDFLELQTASVVVGKLESMLETVGNCGVSNATTSVELEQYLGGALAAAHRWLLEKRLDTNTDLDRLVGRD